MSYNDHSDNIEQQVKELLGTILPNTISNVKNIQLKKMNKSYSYVYFIHYFTNRIELKPFVDNEYLSASLSFYKEAYISMLLGQKSAYILLLRSSLENFVKYLLVYYKLKVDPTRFKKNTNTLRKSGKISDNLTPEIDCFVGMYRDYSGLSHSIVNRNMNLISYLASGTEETEQSFVNCLDSLKKISQKYGYFLIYICKSSLEKWDTRDLKTMLSIIYSDYQVSKITDRLKSTSIK